MSPPPFRQALRQSRFTFGSPALLFAKIRLYEGHVDLSGWQLNGRYHRRIGLRQILHIDVLREETMVLWLTSGEALRLQIKQAVLWKAEMEVHQACLLDTPDRVGGDAR